MQYSAFPDAYAKWEDEATTLAIALGGASPLGLGCIAGAQAPDGGRPGPGTAWPAAPLPRRRSPSVLAAAQAELGGVKLLAINGSTAIVTVTVPGIPTDQGGRALAAWSVAHGTGFSVSAVSVDEQKWADHAWGAAGRRSAGRPGGDHHRLRCATALDRVCRMTDTVDPITAGAMERDWPTAPPTAPCSTSGTRRRLWADPGSERSAGPGRPPERHDPARGIDLVVVEHHHRPHSPNRRSTPPTSTCVCTCCPAAWCCPGRSTWTGSSACCRTTPGRHSARSRPSRSTQVACRGGGRPAAEHLRSRQVPADDRLRRPVRRPDRARRPGPARRPSRRRDDRDARGLLQLQRRNASAPRWSRAASRRA